MSDNGCREKIVSNETLDFFIQHSGNLNRTKELYGAECIQQINEKYVVVHLPFQDIQTIRYINGSFPRLYGLMDMSPLEDSGILRVRRTSALSLLGQGVIIGIIDTGIDYQNPLFKSADGSTRILSLWDQTIQTGNLPNGFCYGSEYTRDDIDAALASDNPYDIVPSVDEIGHGTAMAAIAAGNVDEENDFSGAAPLSDLVIVKLKQAKPYLRSYYYVKDDADAYQENDIIFGLKYMLRTIMRTGRPMVICLGTGTSQGGHDGTGILDEYVNILAGAIGVCIVVPAGNEGNARGHVRESIDVNSELYKDIQLRVGPAERGFSLELWGSSPEYYMVTITSPSGESAVTSTRVTDYSSESEFIFDRTLIYADYHVAENRTGDSFVMLRFENPSEGIWTLRVAAAKGFGGVFDMWLPIHGFITEGTYFLTSDPYTTITGPGNCERPITVTSYDNSNNSIFVDASRGYTRDGRIKPDIAAPGVNIQVPLRLNPTGTGDAEITGIFSGTSVAAAITAGASALLLEWGIVRENRTTLQSTAIKNLLYKGAVRIPATDYPNRTWGYGILNLYESFNSLRGV